MRRAKGVGLHAKIEAVFICSIQRKPPMDVEHINAIGNSLADLTQRTIELRGYL